MQVQQVRRHRVRQGSRVERGPGLVPGLIALQHDVARSHRPPVFHIAPIARSVLIEKTLIILQRKMYIRKYTYCSTLFFVNGDNCDLYCGINTENNNNKYL